jgi:hypothetical protein
VVALYYGDIRVKWASWGLFIASYIVSTTLIILAMKFDVGGFGSIDLTYYTHTF